MSQDTVVVNASIQDIANETMARMIAAGLITPKSKAKKRINWERLLAYEYVNKFYPEIPHWFRCEVGPIPPGEQAMLYAKTRRWADAVLRMDDHLMVIEFKMQAMPGVVSQLQNYLELVPETPLFHRYRTLPVKGKVVCALIDDRLKYFIEGSGLEVEIYQPSNYEDWYRQVIMKEKKE